MKRHDLMELISSLEQDVEFSYNGVFGTICPFSRDDISLTYNGKTVDVDSVEKAMSEPFIDGRSLSDLCEELEI